MDDNIHQMWCIGGAREGGREGHFACRSQTGGRDIDFLINYFESVKTFHQEVMTAHTHTQQEINRYRI